MEKFVFLFVQVKQENQANQGPKGGGDNTNFLFLGSLKNWKWLIEEQPASWRHPYTSLSRINIRWVGVFVSNSARA